MTKILIAPDKFKGVLTAGEVAENVAAGLREASASCKIDMVALADGGEGTADVLCSALDGEWRECEAQDPLGRPITVRYGWIASQKMAVMEMSEAAGMRRLLPNEYNVDRSTTYGVGEMMLAAARAGADEIVVGLGGSATNDGGFGMARALGFHFLANESTERSQRSAANERELTERTSDLRGLSRIVSPAGGLPIKARITAAVDVRNPLLGENGATRVFGPQKGATDEMLEILDSSLARLADVAGQEFGRDFRETPGAGAAGGLGFGLMMFCGASIRSGFDIVADAVGLADRIRAVDLVITGEGKLDRQTREGKTPAGVARLARSLGKPVYAIVGYAEPGLESDPMFDRVWALSGSQKLNADGIARAGEMLRRKAVEVAREIFARRSDDRADGTV
jgi:glycerate kinase